MTSAFDRDSQVERAADGTYVGRVDKRWWVARGPHGGYLAAIALRAMTDAVGDPDRAVRAYTPHFAAAPTEGELTIRPTIERAGRSLSTVSARVEQGDRLIALCLGAFSAAREAIAFDDAPPPEAAQPDSIDPFPYDAPGVPPFVRMFDMRWAIGDAPFTGSDRAVVGGWLRMNDPVAADPFVVTAYMDAWAPAILPRATQPLVAPTIDFTVHFRRPPPTGFAEDAFYLGRFEARYARDGFFEETGELWGPDGELIAQSRQLALTLPWTQPG